MANSERGEIDVKVGEKTYVFRLGINELISLQRALGLQDEDIQEFFQRLGGDLTLEKLRTVVFHGLKRAQPEVTEDDAGDVIDSIGISGVAPLIIESIKLGAPIADPDAKRAGKPRPSRGSRS